MANAYDELLGATIQHLEHLKERGERFVSVSQEALEGLNPSRAPTPPAKGALPQPVRSSQQKEPVPTKSPITRKPVQVDSEPPISPRALPIAPSAPPMRSALNSETKTAALADLRNRAMACIKCAHLASSRKNVVFGVGNADAELMFVGEAPGADEDTQGEPFVGKAGELLTKIIETMGLARDKVYIANILKCRPDTPGQRSGNRKPTPEEMQTCIPFLHEQIDLIQPKVIVALGGTSIDGLLGKTAGIMRLRGTWQTYRGIPLMPTYHPAYLLRNQSPAEKRRVWEDMLQVMEKLGMPISDRQRHFFQNK